uniref:DUF503 domain-containing protein n=1 Tax=Caenorhabditis tropicalis TaxID=1561998 RepID=A0A1I7UC54_9PELO
MMEVTHFETRRRYIRQRLASIRSTMLILINSLTRVAERMNERIQQRNLSTNQMIHLIDVSLEAGLKISSAAADMEHICLKHIEDYIQINNDEIIHLELSLISL